MNKISFTPFEERLYTLASSTREIERYKRGAAVTACVFSFLFLLTVYSLESGNAHAAYGPLFALILSAYALMTCFSTLNFARALRTYRSILRKLASRLAERTGDDSYRKTAAETDDACAPELPLRKAMILLTVFFIGVLWALCVLPLASKIWAAAAAVVFFLLLSARIKWLYANLVIAYKKQCFDLGSELKEKTWPSSGDAGTKK